MKPGASRRGREAGEQVIRLLFVRSGTVAVSGRRGHETSASRTVTETRDFILWVGGDDPHAKSSPTHIPVNQVLLAHGVLVSPC